MTSFRTDIFKTHIFKSCLAMGFEIPEKQADQMAVYAEQLAVWNKKINLTAITDPCQMAEKHFIDSMAVVQLIPPSAGLIDMGSGGGFPGIVIKIMRPDVKILLLDSVRKKISFLKQVIRLLELESIDAVQGRAEDLGRDKAFAGQFDGVISRAFADLAKFIDLACPFIKKNGMLYAMKGKHGANEITADIKKNHKIDIHTYQLPFEQAARSVIILS
jgi:16S rRNA (guanine527-N7)-methyltransferase